MNIDSATGVNGLLEQLYLSGEQVSGVKPYSYVESATNTQLEVIASLNPGSSERVYLSITATPNTSRLELNELLGRVAEYCLKNLDYTSTNSLTVIPVDRVENSLDFQSTPQTISLSQPTQGVIKTRLTFTFGSTLRILEIMQYLLLGAMVAQFFNLFCALIFWN